MALDGKQVRGGTIPSTKLDAAFLATVLRADGSVALTSNLNANGVRIVGLAQPVNDNDAVRLTDLYAIPWKDKVIAATTGNITLSGAQTIDGIALIAGDRCLVRAQSAQADNGIYIVQAGAWARAADADSATELRGACVFVERGTVNADKRYAQTTDTITLGSTSIVWVDIGSGTPAAFDVTSNKNMTASVTTVDFNVATATTIAAKPANGGCVYVYVNGLRVYLGDGVKTGECYFSGDSGTTARAISAIASGDSLYWVGSVAGYQLAATDRIDLEYAV